MKHCSTLLGILLLTTIIEVRAIASATINSPSLEAKVDENNVNIKWIMKALKLHRRGHDECLSSPCRNGGTCIDSRNWYKCQCAPNYTGVNCEIGMNNCTHAPCQNGGTCQDVYDSYTCRCESGYTGKDCDYDLDECASNPCQNGGTCRNLFNGYECHCGSGVSGNICQTAYEDCQDLLLAGYRASGVYTVNRRGSILSIYCDQVTENGGWEVVQRRVDGSVSFDRNWAEYKKGFGQLTGNFWIGNDQLHEMTQGEAKTIRFDLWWFNGARYYATYEDFVVDDESNKYRAHVRRGSYSGTAGDSFDQTGNLRANHVERDFATYDADSEYICAHNFKGGWWFGVCHWGHLNGLYTNSSQYGVGMQWYTLTGHTKPLTKTEMKLRRTDAK